MMAARLPWFPFYYVDFFKDEKVKVMSNAQVGMYVRLLAHQWHEGSLPNEEGALGRIALATPGESDELLALVRACFCRNGRAGRLVNRRLQRIKKEQNEKDQLIHARARKGGLATSRKQAELKQRLSATQASLKSANSELDLDLDPSSSSPLRKESKTQGGESPPTPPLASPSEAWEEVLTRMRRDDHTTRQRPYSHPLIQQTVKLLGGLSAMRADKKPAVLMQQFTQLYADLVVKHQESQ